MQPLGRENPMKIDKTRSHRWDRVASLVDIRPSRREIRCPTVRRSNSWAWLKRKNQRGPNLHHGHVTLQCVSSLHLPSSPDGSVLHASRFNVAKNLDMSFNSPIGNSITQFLMNLLGQYSVTVRMPLHICSQASDSWQMAHGIQLQQLSGTTRCSRRLDLRGPTCVHLPAPQTPRIS